MEKEQLSTSSNSCSTENFILNNEISKQILQFTKVRQHDIINQKRLPVTDHNLNSYRFGRNMKQSKSNSAKMKYTSSIEVSFTKQTELLCKGYMLQVNIRMFYNLQLQFVIF